MEREGDRTVHQNHYNLLDVPFSATRKEITAAYRKRMREWHPDHFRGSDKAEAEEFSKQLNLAYSVLSNAHKRQEYDRSIRVEALQQQIMERYVAGSSSWNTGGQGPMPADAPRRPMSERERREQRITDRNAMRSLVIAFGLLGVAAIALLLVFTMLDLVVRLVS